MEKVEFIIYSQEELNEMSFDELDLLLEHSLALKDRVRNYYFMVNDFSVVKNKRKSPAELEEIRNGKK